MGGIDREDGVELNGYINTQLARAYGTYQSAGIVTKYRTHFKDGELTYIKCSTTKRMFPNGVFSNFHK